MDDSSTKQGYESHSSDEDAEEEFFEAPEDFTSLEDVYVFHHSQRRAHSHFPLMTRIGFVIL